jgi:hypothetical protein
MKIRMRKNWQSERKSYMFEDEIGAYKSIAVHIFLDFRLWGSLFLCHELDRNDISHISINESRSFGFGDTQAWKTYFI